MKTALDVLACVIAVIAVISVATDAYAVDQQKYSQSYNFFGAVTWTVITVWAVIRAVGLLA